MKKDHSSRLVPIVSSPSSLGSPSGYGDILKNHSNRLFGWLLCPVRRQCKSYNPKIDLQIVRHPIHQPSLLVHNLLEACNLLPNVLISSRTAGYDWLLCWLLLCMARLRFKVGLILLLSLTHRNISMLLCCCILLCMANQNKSVPLYPDYSHIMHDLHVGGSYL